MEILGLNARSLNYVKPAKKGGGAKLANSKLATKRALQKAGIATPRLYATINSRSALRSFRWTKLPASFVLKPNNASGGGGIVVVFGRNKKGNWVKADKTELFIPEIKERVLEIMDGRYTTGNVPDSVLFEQRIQIHPDLKKYSVRGIPDLRVLVYNMVPVMAMLRLPTLESKGRANLHTGGVGVGVDLAQGYTTTAVQHGKLIEALPDSNLHLSGIRLPHWNESLLLAARTAKAAGLNFVGVDIAIDREEGPMVLEINARPGLDIQFANMAPLKSRLNRVNGLQVKTAEKGVRLGQTLFSAEVDEEIEDVSGRTVLGVEEEVSFLDKTGQPQKMLVKVDTGAWRTAIDIDLAKKLKIDKPVVGSTDVRAALGRATRDLVDASFVLKGRTIKTKVALTDRSRMSYPAIIGRRDLKGFLVDPARGKLKS